MRKPSIAAIYNVNRRGNITGFFSANLRGHQSYWLSCEVQTLPIATVVKHFNPYLIQSSNKACVLTNRSPLSRITRSYYEESFLPVFEYPPFFLPRAGIKLKFSISQVHPYSPLMSLVVMLQNEKIWLVMFVISQTTLSYPSSPALPPPNF